MGDGVMIWAADPARAITLAAATIADAAPGSLPSRVGVHTGPAVRHGSDWYGSTVSIAARLATEASPGEALISAATRSAAGERSSHLLRAPRELALDGIAGPVVAGPRCAPAAVHVFSRLTVLLTQHERSAPRSEGARMRSGGGHARGNSAAGVVPAAAAAALPSRPVIGGHRDRWSRYVRQVRPRQSGRDGSEPNYRDDLTSDRDPTSCPGRARRARVASASLVDARADVPHTARGSSRRDRGAGETHQQRRGACRRKDRRIRGSQRSFLSMAVPASSTPCSSSPTGCAAVSAARSSMTPGGSRVTEEPSGSTSSPTRRRSPSFSRSGSRPVAG